MIIGSFPPSSRDTFLRFSAANLAIFLPVATDPVKVTTGTSGCFTIGSPADWPKPVITLITPLGRTDSTTLHQCNIDSGVISDGFITTVFPAARAGANFQPISARG